MALDASLGRASVAIRATLDQLDKDLSDARGQVDGAVGRMARGAGQAFQHLGTVALAGIGTAAGAVTGVAAGLTKLAVSAAPVESISAAFDGLATSAGVGGDAMLDALQKGSAGMVSQRDLMMQFNQAAQLVSKDFAVQLPDAMQYLSKISAATGEDMSFMMDSLVKGVGRLSPAILDNLQIQTSLSEATDRAAEMYGVQADELTKAQVQAGMMNVVLGKLAENTASMPDVTDTAAAKMAQWKATIQDTKDQIGVALLPVLSKLMDIGGQIAERVLPIILSAFERIGPILLTAAQGLETFVGYLLHGHPVFVAFQAMLGRMGFADLANQLNSVQMSVRQFLERVREVVAPIAQWIGENVKLQDVLIGVAAAIASVVIPVLATIVSSLAPIIAVFVGIVAVVALLRTAWETNFLGMRTALTEFWNNAVKPAFETLVTWLKTTIPIAIEKMSELWTGTLQPALEQVAEFIRDSVIPVIQNIVTWLQENIPAAVETAKGILQGLKQTFNDILGAIKSVVDWVGRFIDKIRNISLPDFLQRGSLPPLAQTFVDIGDAAERLTRVWPRELQSTALVSAGGGMGGGAGYWSGDIVINGATDPQATAAAVIRALQDRGMLPGTLLR